MTKGLNRRSLEVILEQRQYPLDSYNLYGAHVNEALVLMQDEKGWHVFYSERGLETGPTYLCFRIGCVRVLFELVSRHISIEQGM